MINSPHAAKPRLGLTHLGAEPGALAKHDPWFGPKRVGAGWGPRTRRGCLTIAVFTAVVVGITVFGTMQNS